jgi:hypothetical protein
VTALLGHAGPLRPKEERNGLGVPLALVVASSFVVGALVADPLAARLALAGGAIVLVLGAGVLAPRRLLYLLVVWMAVLGFTRRILTDIAPMQGNDPLLLVGPAALSVVTLEAIRASALRNRTRLSNAVLALCLLMLVSVLNPLQGNLQTGLAGLLFMFVPVLGFWIGRVFADDRTLKTVLGVVAAVAVGGATYGLFQTFHGFPHWDEAWIQRVRSTDYIALGVQVYDGGQWHSSIRPFSTFSAASEYAIFLAVALVVWLVFGLRSRRFVVTAAAAGLIFGGIVYQASRGVIVGVVLTLVLLIAAWRGARLWLAVLVCVGALLLLPAAAARFEPDGPVSGNSSVLVLHQIRGLSNPFDPNASTLGVHLYLLEQGLRSAIHNPVGHGVGSVSLAGHRFGGATKSTETDPSNVAVALGAPGLLAYLVVVALGFLKAYRLAVSRRDPLPLVVVGVLAVTFLQWLNGGQYAVAFLPWLALGWVDRQNLHEDERHVPRPPTSTS